MPTESDPSFHQSAERQMIAHVTQLLSDPRLVLDTTAGRKSAAKLIVDVASNDSAAAVQRTMSEMNVPDRALLSRMPAAQTMTVTLRRQRLMIFRQTIGQLRVVCVSPMRDLIAGKEPAAMDARDVQELLRQLPPPIEKIPLTLVLVSTSGFTAEARQLVDRGAHRTVILAQPNATGGWSIFGPTETKALNDLLDPEADDEKKKRVRAVIEASQSELLQSGIAADRIAARSQLPLQLVENELKSFAKQSSLAAKRLDGRLVAFREGTIPASTLDQNSGALKGLSMPLVDRIRALFARKGETEKKIAFLSERRTALAQQRDRAFEAIGALEAQDEDLREQFKSARAPLTKRRITSQLVQLRKDIERRQQMTQVLNQQVNVVSTHLHNLELTRQGEVAQLPDSEEIAADAAAAEETIAQLQADSELAESVSGVAATGGMSDEEQALYDELEKEMGGGAPAAEKSVEPARTPTAKLSETPRAETARRAEPEAG